MTTESQEYRPVTRKRRIEAGERDPSSSDRRTSRRLTTKNEVFCDPVQNLAYFEEALGTATAKKDNSSEMAEARFPCKLEIKDSVDDDDLDGPGPISHLPTLLPQTPKKNRAIVLSSQSPESLPPSTRRTERIRTELPPPSQRTPLAERSVNIPLGTMSNFSPGKPPRSLRRSAKKKKIITLKLPKRRQPPGPTRIENSQANLWSIPSSSSPRQRGNRTITDQATPQPQMPVQVQRQSSDAEIPATSQAQLIQSSPPDVETQDTLPDLTEVIGGLRTEKSRSGQVEKTQGQQSSLGSGAAPDTIVRDFALFPIEKRTAATRAPGDADHLPASLHISLPRGSNRSVQDGDMDLEDADFGSPIANNTQFNVAVEHRVSSPPPLELTQQTETIAAPQLPAPSGTPQRQSLGSPDKNIPKPAPGGNTELLQTPLPSPRLVEQSTAKIPQKIVLDSDDDSDEMALPKPATLHRSSTHISTTKVPLNDTAQQSSSPSLPSTKLGTPRSVHPASLPHPSQMSTQEATQGYLNMSSYPPQHGERSSDDDKAEKITIKDSSSCHVSMSQLPQYARETQSQQVDIDLGLDAVLNGEAEAEEEEGDLDLDPPTLTRPAQPDLVLLDEHELATPRQQRAQGQTSNPKGPAADPDIEGPEPRIPQRHVVEDHDPDISQTHIVDDDTESPVRSSQSISIPSSPHPPPLQREYSPIPGFNNETQSNFTQNGHVTAAYVHRQHEAGVLPKWFIPQPYQVPGYTRRK